ncbi:hypothetical protein D3C81_1775310 [compost metagenome]
MIQLGNQLAALHGDLTHLPLAAAVEQRQLALVPTPLIDQALEQPALPAVASCAVQAAEFFVDLKVKAAPCQL